MFGRTFDSLITITLDDTAKFRGVKDSDEYFNYSIINDRLVPNSFLDRIALHLSDKSLKYGEVLSPRRLCGDDFFFSLTNDERQVLGPCILLLIGVGLVTMTFPGEKRSRAMKPSHTPVKTQPG